MRRAPILLATLIVGCSCEPTAADFPDREPDPIEGDWFDSPREGMHVFVSGHSLVDNVFGPRPPEDSGPIADIAEAAGKDHHSLLQAGAGSTAWLRHQDMDDGEYPVPDWSRFDTLLILERADLAYSITFENSLREVGWFVDQIRGAPPGDDEVFFYQTWWGYDEGRAPLRTWPAWVEYVRAELPLAECVAEIVGRRRGIHVRVLPAGGALAELMERVDRGEADGLTWQEIWAEDKVHLSELGYRYIAMAVFAALYRTPSAGVPVEGLSESRAAFFASLVDPYIASYYDDYEAPTASECRDAHDDMCSRLGRESGFCDPEDYFADSLYGTP